MKKLNLGCGKDIKKGYVNLDYIKLPGIDVVHDIEKFPWPFKDNTFDVVYTSHVLEHVSDLNKTLKEIHRISKNNAEFIIRVPHFSSGVTYRDPTHKRVFSYFTMEYFATNSKEFYERPDEFKLFRIEERKLNYTRLAFTFLNPIFNPILNINPAIYERFFCWIFPCSEILLKLKVIKKEK